ncbi:MAG: zf-TFIIB domain-containing protein [Acidobacteria bacterium]|nr:zf-TFIIB domain-containing protein [Acidobacteriota bacterium]
MKRPANPEALNCPNCGGAVMSDRTQCEFCKSRLKTVGCPSCLGLMFLGAKFCKHCGKKVTAVSVVEEKETGSCPRCKLPLHLIEVGDVRIRECAKCGGFWSGNETFETICANSEQQEAVLGFIGSEAHPHAHPAVISYVPCPDCSHLMNRSNFARTSGIIIDMCREHGIWFDADELPKIITFINGGGMSRAREKEKAELEYQRSRLREEERRLVMMERRSGGGRFDNTGTNSTGSFIKSVIDLFFN